MGQLTNRIRSVLYQYGSVQSYGTTVQSYGTPRDDPRITLIKGPYCDIDASTNGIGEYA